MVAFEHALVLLLLIASLSVVGRWLPWPQLITYLLGGMGAALVRAFPRLTLDPGFFFLCFLPPLLFADGWLMPLREFVRARRPILTLAPGAYTAVITGSPVNGVETSGVALGEIYEDDNQSARLVNLSSRGFVSPGASVMIPGFVTSTGGVTALKKFLIRGVGPALLQFGVANALLNPTLTVVDSAGKTVATNDDWEQNTNVAELRAVTLQQAFPLAAGSKDAAILLSLAPGSYTCLVSGVGNTSGTALVEIYEVP